MPPTSPRIGISRCLLGEEVRYDGGHKRDPFLLNTVGQFVDWVPVCPEVEAGMGIPREAIHLIAADDGVVAADQRVRLVGVKSGHDWTDAMVRSSRKRVRELTRADLSGYVLKKDSPSCGMERVRVQHGSVRTRNGRGLFAEALLQAMPNLPIEEEGRLNDPALRENFIERVFAYQRVRAFFGDRWRLSRRSPAKAEAGDLVRFHTHHKLQLLSHSRGGYTELGQLVAGVKGRKASEMAGVYEAAFMRTLARVATPGRHADVMMHIVGHLKRLIDAADRQELLDSIEEHRRGQVPLVVPITLIRHHVRRHDVAYLREQTYLDPHPRELALRNHV